MVRWDPMMYTSATKLQGPSLQQQEEETVEQLWAHSPSLIQPFAPYTHQTPATLSPDLHYFANTHLSLSSQAYLGQGNTRTHLTEHLCSTVD